MSLQARRFVFRLAAALAVLIALAPGSARAAGEQFGRIRGIVTDATSQPLPGLVIVATSPALIGAPRTVMTDMDGRYELIGLPPGRYTLELSYPGSTEPNVRNADVRMGETTTVNVTYAVLATGVSNVDVQESRSLTRPDSTHTGSVRDMNTLNRVPVARQYQSAVLQVPGTSGGANPNIKGGLSYHNRFLVDGMDTTDPISQTFAMNLSWESMEAIEVITGGFDAEYNALGGIINVVPRGGGDDYHANLAAFVNHYELSAQDNVGTQPWESFKPFDDSPVGPQASYEISANLGGPIIKRKLWWGLTYQYNLTESSLLKGEPLGIAPYDIQHPPRRYTGHMLRARLDYAPTAKHRFRLQYMMDPASLDNTAQSNRLLGVAENHQNQGGRFIQLRWDWLAGENVTATVLAGYALSSLEIGPQGRLGKVDFTGCDKFSDINCSWDANRPQRYNSNDATTWHQGDAYRVDDRHRLQVDPSVSLRGEFFGRHNAKIGLQIQYLWRERTQATPGGVYYEDTHPDGLLLEAGLCDPVTFVGCDRKTEVDNYAVKQTGYAAGLFLQDKWWTPLQWLTVNPGVRLDYGVTMNRNGKTVTQLLAFSPRLGLTADVTRDGRNILFAYYGRATDVMPLWIAAEQDVAEVAGTRTYEFDQMTKQWGTTPIITTGGAGNIVIDKNPSVPRTDELTGGVRREFWPGTMAGVEYTWKRITNDWDGVEINRIWDPTGVRVVDYVDRTKIGQTVDRYTTPYNPRYYQGVILKSEGRPTPKWDYHVSHTLSWTTFRSTEVSNLRQLRFSQGWSSADIRHFSRAQVSYYLLPDLNIGAVFQYLSSGDALTRAYYNRESNSRANSRTPAGTTTSTPNDPKGITEFRVPALTQLDLTLRYNLLDRDWQHRLTLVVDVFNVLNTRVPTGIQASDLPTFGQVTSRQRPFRFQVGLSYSY